MAGEKGRVKELSVQRPKHQVDLVEGAVEDAGPRVLCMTEISKPFVIVKLVELWSWSKARKVKKSVILIEESEVQLIKSLLEGVSIHTSLIANSFYSRCSRNEEVLNYRNADIILISSVYFLEFLAHGKLSISDLSLVIVNSCHHVLDKDHSVAKVVEKLTAHYQQSRGPKLVGVTSELLAYQSCHGQMENFLSELEAVFQCCATISSDLLAMTRYGEQIVDECSSYSDKPPNDAVSLKLAQILQTTLCFLNDCQPSEETKECITFLTFLISECHSILGMFGASACAHTGRVIARECAKFAKKYAATESEVFLQFCRTQTSLLHSHLTSLKGDEGHLTSLTGKLFGVLLELRVDGKTPHGNTHHEHEVSDSTNTLLHTEAHEENFSLDEEESLKSVLNPSLDLQGNLVGETGDLDGPSEPKAHLLEAGETHKTRVHCGMKESEQNNRPKSCPQTSTNLSTKNKTTKDPFCIVLVRSNIIAQALSKLINALAEALPDYSFLRSQFLCGKRASEETSTQKSLDGQEGIMNSIQEGSINVLVTTYEAECDIYVSRCSLVIRLGLPPVDYVHYQQIKQKARASGAKFFVFVPEEKEEESCRKVQEFQQIELVLQQRCFGFHAPATQFSRLFAGSSSLAVYKPYGDDGPLVDMLGSIALVNRYCARFPNDGLNFPIPRLHTEERWTDEDVKFVSYLYLPRNSPIYWPIKGFASVKKQKSKSALDKAKVQSQMSAALNACMELHRRDELDSNLDPVGKRSNFEFLGEDSTSECEVADGGTGMAGSMKRKRGYKRKIPSVFDHNLPVAGEKVHVYSISMRLVKPGEHERAIRSQITPDPSSLTYSLGILSRKPLSRLPDFNIYDRAGEMTVTVTALRDSLVLSHEQLCLVKRFHGYVFNRILNFGKTPGGCMLSFDQESAVDGCLVVLLKNAEQMSNSQVGASLDGTVAFEFIRELEKSLEDFEDPKDPPPVGLQDFEVLRHKVLVTTYAETKLRYYVIDICYDRSPMDPFPSPEIAPSFKEYYDVRYDVNISPHQPLLDVDHVSVRLNFLVPRHQDTKGRDLALPGKDSKRAQKGKVYLVPELCGIHPIPAYLWRRITNLPTILYRMESLLLAEELRSSIARETGVGSVEWPRDVPLPPLTSGELVGESFQVTTPAQDAKIAKGPGSDYVTGTSIVEDAEGIIEHETKKESQDPLTPLPAETHLECLGAELNKATQSRDSKGALSESGRTLVTMEICSQLTGSQAGEDPGMKAKLEYLQREGISTSQGNTADCSAEKDTSGTNQVLARFDSETSSVPQVSATGVVQQVQNDLVEKFSRLTIENLQHTLEESPASHCKAADAAEGSVDASSALRDPPMKCHSEVSLSPKSLVQASDFLTEGDPVQQAESAPVVSVPINSSIFAPHGPPCTLILRALTCGGAGDMFSLERLEMYGDSFVKYVISAELFHKYPHDNEGKLSFLRGLTVSNRQLFYLGRRRGIPAYMFTRYFDPSSAWTPPAFCVDVEENQKFSLMKLTPVQDANEDEEDEEEACFVDQTEEVTEPPARSPHLNSYLHHVVSDKAVADATEALVGAYLVCCGPEGAIRVLSWLGMEFSFHKKESEVGRMNSAILGSEVAVDREYKLKPISQEVEDSLKHVEHVDVPSLRPKFQEVEDSLRHVDQADADSLQQEFQEIEKSLKYIFTDKSLLLQAFTHSSYPREYSAVKSSYEQLEFLGDALMDFLLTRHLYFYQRDKDPGAMTDLRSALVNNYTFSSLAVRCGLHRHLRSMSPPLFKIVNEFVVKHVEAEREKKSSKPDQVFSTVFSLPCVNNEDSVDVEVPKVLGDLFEAVVGAVYVDSGMDPERVWHVFFPLLKPFIDHYSVFLPISPVRQLLEMKINAARFSPPERTMDGKYKCTLIVNGLGKFVGLGRSSRIAKSAAAQRALKRLQAQRDSK